jgi:hypothetical protein
MDMSRYYFHMRRGNAWVKDPEGAEYPTIEAAMVDAVDSAYSLLIHSIQDRREIYHDVLEVTDEDGVVLEQVWFQNLVLQLLSVTQHRSKPENIIRYRLRRTDLSAEGLEAP